MIPEPVLASLRRHGLLSLPRASSEALLLSQMRIGLFGGAADLPMTPTDLSHQGALPSDVPAAVICADRDSVTVALVTRTLNGVQVTERESFPTPGLEYPAPWEDFVYLAAELAEPIVRQAACLGFCYALPGTPEGRDIIAGSPDDLCIDGAAGQKVCTALTAELASRDLPLLPCAALNDAAAALLAGTLLHPGQDRYFGLAWDRDLRLCLAAPRVAIPKLTGPGSDRGFVLVDTGLGGFTGVPLSDADLILDRDAADAGRNLLRKTASLPALGEVARFILLKGVEDGLFSFECGRGLLALTSLPFRAVDELLREQGGHLAALCPVPEDRAVAEALCRAVCDRAVELTAAALTAAGRLTGAKDSVCITAAGGWTDTILLPLLRDALPDRTIDVPEDAALLGAAVAAWYSLT